MKKQLYAVGSGLLASMASLLGKIATSNGEAGELCEKVVISMYANPSTSTFCDKYVIGIRVLFFILMILTNIVMWTTFSKALQFASNSVEATITNAAANFLFTAIVSEVVFGEKITSLWWSGIVFILIGLIFIHHENSVRNDSKISKAKQTKDKTT